VRKRLLRAAVGIAIVIALLYLPDCPADPPERSEGEPFAWNQDAMWEALEARFAAARGNGCGPLDTGALRDQLAALEDAEPDDPRWLTWERGLFGLAAETAACPERAPELVAFYGEARTQIRRTALGWDLEQPEARQRLYRLLQGGRMAIEEVMLQMPPAEMPVVVRGEDVASEGPCTTLHDTRVCSGDILLSRGGAPTSALIARGSDYPGSFSHVALVHVSEDGTFRTIEAHIEVGVVVAGVEKYQGDPKLRVMLLRPRPEALDDPAIPHRAASAALAEAQRRHIAYDFAMDFDDPERQFCSEVASTSYANEGVQLWRGLTKTSGEGTARWLSRFGVKRFETHGPSDLEHDPQLAVVAEWRDPETLFQAHVDDAVVDALLEGAADGDEVGYAYARLPFARLAKAYSWVRGLFGTAAPVPEGMSATVALRVEWLRERHGAMADAVRAGAEAFREEHGYAPPYWELVKLARAAR